MALDDAILGGDVRALVAESGAPDKASLLLRALRTTSGRIGAALAGFVVLVAAVGPLIAPDSPTAFTAAAEYQGPGAGHLLGSDVLARDVLSRLLCGGWELLLMAGVATILGVGIGALVGIAAALEGGKIEATVMRVVDVLLAFPQLVLALLLVSVVGPKIWLIVLAVAIGHAPQTARLMRAAAMDVCERDFVRAMDLMAMPRWRIVTEEVLPNVTSPLMVDFGLRLTYSVMIIASLSFLGFGLQPPNPNWGAMINENRGGVTANPWAVLAPVVMIALLTVGINLFTDAIARVSLRIDKPAEAAGVEPLDGPEAEG